MGVTANRTTSAPATSGHSLTAPFKCAGTRVLVSTVRLLSGLAIVSALGFSSVASAQNVSCTCRYKGEKYSVGDSVCLKSPNGLRMATCSMVLNNTSWQFSNAPCPLTSLERGGGKPDIENMTPVVPGKAS